MPRAVLFPRVVVDRAEIRPNCPPIVAALLSSTRDPDHMICRSIRLTTPHILLARTTWLFTHLRMVHPHSALPRIDHQVVENYLV